MAKTTSKGERRRRKHDWLRWRTFSRTLTRTGTVTDIKPDPRSSLAAFCRWHRQDVPPISLRVGLIVEVSADG
jgi:hypothetical protein